MAYADDILIVGRRRETIEETYVILKREAGRIGLEINVSKTKLMIIERMRQQQIT